MKSMLRITTVKGTTAPGSSSGNARVCALDRSIEQALVDVHLIGRNKDILFARTTGHDGLRMLADPEQVAGVIAAVLANAIHRSPSRGIVTLDIRPGVEGIVLAISDQGPRQPAAFRGFLAR